MCVYHCVPVPDVHAVCPSVTSRHTQGTSGCPSATLDSHSVCDFDFPHLPELQKAPSSVGGGGEDGMEGLLDQGHSQHGLATKSLPSSPLDLVPPCA